MKINKRLLSLGLAGFVLAGSFSLQGCYGSFGLTKKLYTWNGSIKNKWVKELVFFVAALPVYGLAILVDTIGTNLIEFWTGSNPVASGNTFDKTYANGVKVHAEKLADGRLSVRIVPVQGEARSFVLTREADGISASDIHGTWMGKVAETERGMVLVRPQVALGR